MASSRRAKRISISIVFLASLVLLFIINIIAYQQEAHLIRSEILTGYSLFGIFVLLSLFNIRKRFPVVPQLGRAYWWHQIHLVFGLLGVLLYMTHVGTWWPDPGYERWVTAFFYIVILSGLLGVFLQYRLPKKLTQNQDEIIFERIPDAIFELKSNVRKLIENSVKTEKSEVLLRLHQQYLSYYFARPRFVVSNLLGNRNAEFNIDKHINATRQYCNDAELEILTEIKTLTYKKIHIDRHYAYQLAMKLWLFIHIPAVTGLMLISVWHLLLVNIYSL